MNDNKRIKDNLKDSGCDSDFIIKFLKASDKIKQLEMLEEHRARLLDCYHDDIKKLDCLDYLIYDIRKSVKK